MLLNKRIILFLSDMMSGWRKQASGLVGSDDHADTDLCFHCKCEKCGKLIHLHCDEIEEMQMHLFSEHRFKMNPMRTVFYGLCEQCQ